MSGIPRYARHIFELAGPIPLAQSHHQDVNAIAESDEKHKLLM